MSSIGLGTASGVIVSFVFSLSAETIAVDYDNFVFINNNEGNPLCCQRLCCLLTIKQE